MSLTADFYFDRAADISPEFLKKHGIKAVLLDIDNTLTLFHAPLLYSEREREWLQKLKESGIKACVLSNNSDQGRVQAFSDITGLPFVSNAAKPLPGGVKRGCALLGVMPSEAAVIGDQIFTDIAAAKNARCCAILVGYFEKEISHFFKLKRALEAPFVKKSMKRRA